MLTMIKFLLSVFLLTLSSTLFVKTTYAISDPFSEPVNKFGVNILSPDSEIEEAAKLVNNNGDWGWAVVVIKKSERNVDRWQSFLNLAAKNHIIPIVRLATEFDKSGYWQKPTDEDANDWADFLSKLYWPTKNRYIQIYNEVNRASEWGGVVDASDYAKELEKTIGALKAKSADFFVLNAPPDLALETSATSLNSAVFFQTMESSSPGIFKKLDGWASHSYPNPNFSASPLKSGKTGIDGYKWELKQIDQFLENKKLPVFITETGWKRETNSTPGLDEKIISVYFKIAFEKVWNDKQVISVSPFVFNYPEPLFNAFAFKSNNSEKEFHDYYYSIKDLGKTRGEPQREDMAIILEDTTHHEITSNKSGNKLTFKIKNTGNFIWNTKNGLTLNLKSDSLDFTNLVWNKDEIFPGEAVVASVDTTTEKEGKLALKLELSNNEKALAEKELTVQSESYFSIIFKTFLIVFNSFGKTKES